MEMLFSSISVHMSMSLQESHCMAKQVDSQSGWRRPGFHVSASEAGNDL